MNMIQFIIDGEPKGKARPRVTKTHTYTPQSTAEYEKLVALSYQNEAKGKTFGDKPIYLNINAFFSIPKRTSRKNRELMMKNKIYATKKPDADNIIKIIADALNGVAYNDDKQIIMCSCGKYYTDGEPFVCVYIQEI